MMLAGFVSTVLMHRESVNGLIHIATLILYVMTIAVSIAIINVVSANLEHFGLQRYLAYTVGMFYSGGYLLVRKSWLMRKA